MKHTPITAAKSVRALMERTSRIARTRPEFRAEQAYRQSLPAHERPGGGEWASAYQAYRLTAEQVHGPGRLLTDEQSLAIQQAIEIAMPELFAEYWEQLPQETRP